MKTSFYTYQKAYDDKLLMYNCRTDSLIVLNKDLCLLWNQYKDDKLEQLENVHPSLFKCLVEKKFIVDSELVEPVDFLEELRHSDETDEEFTIYVNPTLNCNLRCWYCYEKHRPQSQMHNDVKDAILHLVEQKVQNPTLKRIGLSFFGGEPLLEFKSIVMPLVTEVSKFCKQHGKLLNVSFTSNCSLLSEDMVQQLNNVQLTEPIAWQITIDGNRSVHDQVRKTASGKGSYDKILNGIRLLVANNMKVLVRFNYQNSNVLSFLDVIEDFKSIPEQYAKNLSFHFQRIWQDKDSPFDMEESETNPQKVEKAFLDAGFTFSTKDYKPQRCYADSKNSIVVNYNGLIYNCTAQDFVEDESEGKLMPDGEIKTNAKYALRMQKRYDNKTCINCNIFPICFGGCSQKQMNRPNQDMCIKGWDTDKKEKAIQQRIRSLSDLYV